MLKNCLVIGILLNFVAAELKFPDGFKLGVATASYQIEGGWNSSGKGQNIWDTLTHNHPDLISDQGNGDVACDSYHLWKEDVEILKFMKVDHYRFSLSWTRILPTGFVNELNPDGITYYNNLINLLIQNGIEPIVTLYHWDLPQPLQDLGGWTNPLIADYFRDFAEVAFQQFGDRVKTWITINEPSSICVDTYEYDVAAPAFVRSLGIGLYLCGKTILLAHAKAFRLYENKFKATQKGEVGITIDAIWAEPKTNQTKDLDAAEREMQLELGWWAHPIFSKNGNYPDIMIRRVSDNSRAENFPESRLPVLSPDEIELIQGSFDFFGLNHYHTWLVSDKEYPGKTPLYEKDKGTELSKDPNWNPKMVPWGLRKLLNWVKKEYGNVKVFITENGYEDGGGLKDSDRVLFLYSFMKNVLLAIGDGCNVIGYTVWSILDNMEWRSGYTVKFGLYEVNFTDPKRSRTPKISAGFYKYVIQNRTLPEK